MTVAGLTRDHRVLSAGEPLYRVNTRQTVWRISKTREFKKEYRSARGEAFSQSLGRLQQASGAAVSTLLKVMVDKTTPPASRVRAADRVLDHAAKATELENIEARLAELEQAVNPSEHDEAPTWHDFSGSTRGNVVMREGPDAGTATITTEGRLVQSRRHVEAALA